MAAATASITSDGDARKMLTETDHACRNLRKVLQQNSKEGNACLREQQKLDKQKKCMQAKVTREEKELRAQLKRLQDERKMHSLGDNLEHVDHQDVFAGSIDYDPDEHAVVNPYPITFPGRKISAPCRIGLVLDSQEDGLRSASRAISVNGVAADDLETLKSSSVTSLPPILSTSPGISSALSRSRSSRSNLSATSEIQHYRNISSSSSSIWSNDDEGPDYHHHHQLNPNVNLQGRSRTWVGDPEAISSVRRPRKSVAQQRKENHKNRHLWTRSSSLKEGSRGPNYDPSAAVTRSNTIMRSRSMKERPSAGSPSGSLLYLDDGSPLSLSRSSSRSALSSVGGSPRGSTSTPLCSIESLTDAIQSAEISPAHAVQQQPQQQSYRLRSYSSGSSGLVKKPSLYKEKRFQILRSGSNKDYFDVLTINIEPPPATAAEGEPLPPISPRWESTAASQLPPTTPPPATPPRPATPLAETLKPPE